MLESIETCHANERAYQETDNLWQTTTANPESHPGWMQFYANALRDALRKSNSRRKETLATLNIGGHWSTGNCKRTTGTPSR